MIYKIKNYDMKTIKKQCVTLLIITMTFFFASCGNDENKHDASGCFEAEETIISAEATGIIKQFDLQEGQQLVEGQLIGYIDSTQLFLKKKQLESQIHSLLKRKPDVALQLSSLRSQLQTAKTEQKRVAKLLEGDGATQKQLDDINAQIEFLEKQIEAQTSALNITGDGLENDAATLQIQVEQLEDQISKCRLVSKQNGTVLVKIAHVNELTATGKALYKIADLQNITLRAYITSSQLTHLKIGQSVNVFADFGEKETRRYDGTLTWISEKSEFTPKTIQTQDERANLVYAVKINVKNDGYLKIGMHAQVDFIDN